MTNKNELKVFNYFYLNDKWQPNRFNAIVKIQTIELHGCKIEILIKNKWESIDFITKYQYLDPIPINGEWLLKFGFTQSPAFKSLYFVGTFLNITLGDKIMFEINDHIISEIKYIHELQNLYFALTGEELTLSVT